MTAVRAHFIRAIRQARGLVDKIAIDPHRPCPGQQSNRSTLLLRCAACICPYTGPRMSPPWAYLVVSVTAAVPSSRRPIFRPPRTARLVIAIIRALRQPITCCLAPGTIEVRGCSCLAPLRHGKQQDLVPVSIEGFSWAQEVYLINNIALTSYNIGSTGILKTLMGLTASTCICTTCHWDGHR